MKIEVIDVSTETLIEAYYIQEVSRYDFKEWRSQENEVIISLDRLLYTVENLDSTDTETSEPISSPQEVDYFLPNPQKFHLLSRLVKMQSAENESPNQTIEELNKTIKERVFTPELKLSLILSAVATEIFLTHYPPSNFKVKISDE